MTSKDEDLWLHFEDLGNLQAKCKVCNKIVSFKTSTTNLRAHFERLHGTNTPLATTTPHQLFVTSTTLTTDEILKYSSANKATETLSEQSDTDTQNNSQTANTESSDVEPFTKKVTTDLDEMVEDRSSHRPRTIKRRMKRPSLRGGARHIDTDEDFGRLISKKMHLLPLAIRCGLEVDILRMVNGALNAMDKL